jgi:chromosomal replication initiator protein
VSESTWHIWLERVGFRELAGTTLVLEAPDDVRSWVETRFTRLLTALAETVIGPGARVDIVGPQEHAAPERLRPEAQRAEIAQELNPRLTFDQFVIGDCNRLAHAAALAVAEMPGLAYNPLFICGPPGLGKTHLLHSIANYVHEHGAGLTARYTTVEAFTDHFVSAVQGGGMEAFKAAYRGVDVLLVDDVQFLQS